MPISQILVNPQNRKNMDNDFMRWTLNVGKCTQALRILSRDSACCMKTLAELERAVPQFHRQPGLMRELDSKLTAIIQMLDQLAKELEYPQPKPLFPEQFKMTVNNKNESLENPYHGDDDEYEMNDDD
jgi:hypothetical protein